MTYARLLALDALYAGAGGAVLFALGLTPSWRACLRLGGLALLLGWAIVGVSASYLLMAGFAATIPQVLAAVVAAVAIGGAIFRWRVPASPPCAVIGGFRASRVAFVSAALLVVYLVALLARAVVSGVTWWDAWAFWIPKAMSIVLFGGLDVGEGAFASFANPDQPPLIPALHALGFRFLGATDPTPLAFQDWVLAAGALWALAGLLGPRVPPRILWPSLLMLAATPNFGRLVGSLTGDEPLALVFTLAGVSALLWRLDGDAAYGVISAMFLAALPLVKSEGLYLAVSFALLLALVTAPRLSRTQAVAASLAVVPICAVLPWRLWLDRHGIESGQNFVARNALRPQFLLERLDRLSEVLRELPWYFLDPRIFLLTVPLVGVAAAIGRRQSPAAARLVLGVIVISFVGAAGVYWISRPELGYHLGTSAARIPTPPLFLCAAMLPLLLADTLRPAGGRE